MGIPRNNRLFRCAAPAEPEQETDLRLLRIGWHADAAGLWVPKSALPCSGIHCRAENADGAQLGELLCRQCGRLGADTVVLESPDDACVAAAARVLHGCGIRCCSPTGAEGALRIVRDTDPRPASSYACRITARCTLTELSPGGIRREVTRSELEQLVRESGASLCRSEELSAVYATLHMGNAVFFALFDTEDTLRERAVRRLEEGAVVCFL